jgi:hypothetical protein
MHSNSLLRATATEIQTNAACSAKTIRPYKELFSAGIPVLYMVYLLSEQHFLLLPVYFGCVSKNLVFYILLESLLERCIIAVII